MRGFRYYDIPPNISNCPGYGYQEYSWSQNVSFFSDRQDIISICQELIHSLISEKKHVLILENILTHFPLVPHIFVGEMGQH